MQVVPVQSGHQIEIVVVNMLSQQKEFINTLPILLDYTCDHPLYMVSTIVYLTSMIYIHWSQFDGSQMNC